MKILVINAGSSSLKYQLINMDDQHVLAKGNCERIGISGGQITHKTSDGKKWEINVDFPSHTEAFETLKDMLLSGEGKVIDSLSEVAAVGHRIVQGAEKYKDATLITDSMLAELSHFNELAPLHNPAEITAILACQKTFGANVPEVAVFDTAFHAQMPPKAYIYGIPYEYYEKDGIRRYGFHGTSHRYVSQRYAQIVQKPIASLKLITCHLGNGSSIAAVDGGISIDTTMGFTPLAGLLMGTRCGDLDASVVTYLAEKHQLSPDEVNTILNKKSGFLGISGISSDARDLEEASEKGHVRAQLAYDMLTYQIKKYIGAYAAAMGGLDAILFTGGIGENDRIVRYQSTEGLQFMGIEVDPEKNKNQSGSEADISTDSASVRTWIVPTNEELMIALDTKATIEK